MDIRKVKADQLILLACLPCILSLVSNLEEEASGIYVELSGNICFIHFSSKLNGKTFGIQLKQCLLWAQVSNFNLLKVGYYPVLPLAAVYLCLLSIVIYFIVY